MLSSKLSFRSLSDAASASPPPVVEKAGVLRLRSTRLGIWTKRHWRTSGQHLLCHRKGNESKLRGDPVDLLAALSVGAVGRFGELELAFPGGKALRVKAKSVQEASEWVAFLQSRVDSYRR